MGFGGSSQKIDPAVSRRQADVIQETQSDASRRYRSRRQTLLSATASANQGNGGTNQKKTLLGGGQ